jgi:alcohol dehydrogenase (cytochrome c)
MRAAAGPSIVAALIAAQPLAAQVTFERILHAEREPQNWLSYSGTVDSRRYSLLDEIDTRTVGDLELQWVWQARSLEKFEATPLVVDGILYTVQAPNDVVALDAATGRVFWTYHHEPAPEARVCCGRVNRGLAILGDTLYMGTVDAHLLAIDAKSGKLLWDTVVADVRQNFSITMSPNVFKDKVIIGTAGGDMGIRGHISAFDAKSGREVWRFYTIPAPGEPGNETWSGDSWRTGGAAVWNPAPDWDGSVRLGDNLYSNSVVALDVDTGELKWHYQFTPHDELDYDSTQVPVLADIDWRGTPRKVMLWANRNGILYVLDRVTGEFLHGKPYVKHNWWAGFDESGRLQRLPGMEIDKEPKLFYPHVHGAINWAPTSFSPRTGLYYVSHWENSSIVAMEGMFPQANGINRRQTAMGQVNLEPFFNDQDEAYGVIRAYDPHTLDPKWEHRMADITWAGVLTTAGDVVFGGGREGYFLALDARTGELLWRESLGGQINAAPMTYAVNGRQHVAIAAGSALFSFALPERR